MHAIVHHWWEKALYSRQIPDLSCFLSTICPLLTVWFLPSETWLGILRFRNLFSLPFLTNQPTRPSIPCHFLMPDSLKLQAKVRDPPGSEGTQGSRQGLLWVWAKFRSGPARAFWKESTGQRSPLQAGKVGNYYSYHSIKSNPRKAWRAVLDFGSGEQKVLVATGNARQRKGPRYW